jgi:hypothetical protein
VRLISSGAPILAWTGCRLHYDDVGEINELEDYLVTTMLPLPDKIDDECPECGMAITGSTDSLRMLSSKDFLCIDFETPTGTDGAGPLRSGCIGNVSTLPVDLEWASNPNSETAPCCRNQSIVFASLYLVAEAALYYSNTHVAHGNMTYACALEPGRSQLLSNPLISPHLIPSHLLSSDDVADFSTSSICTSCRDKRYQLPFELRPLPQQTDVPADPHA